MSGVALPHGCRVTHGTGAAIKRPFADLTLVMHELSPGGASAFSGPYGFIAFDETIRLPRHVHLAMPDRTGRRRFLAERILVLNGCGLVELAGTLYVVAPGSLVDIGPGVPHAWTACPPGLRLPDDTCSDGTFLMIYQYEAATDFFPVAATAPLDDTTAYRRHEGGHDALRIAPCTSAELADMATMVWNDASVELAT